MSVRSLLKKEVLWSRHKALTLLFLLVLLPGLFAYTSVAFEHVIPRDSPVGVVGQDDAVTDAELDIVEAGFTEYSDPVRYASRDAAFDALQREEIYAIVAVPSGITDGSESVTFRIYVDGTIVPFKEPSKAIRSTVAITLDRALPADVSVRRVVVGEQNTLSEYLVPVFLVVVVFLYAFAYVPYALSQDANVLDRLRVESSLDAVVGAKLLYFSLLLFLPILVFQAAAVYFSYAVDPLRASAIGVLLVTFLYLVSCATTVMILTRFSTLGRFVNVVLMLGLLTFSGLVYPAGFFSPLRRQIVRHSPVHYSMVALRSVTLRSTPVSLYRDMLLGIVAVAVASLVVLKLAIVHYERRA
jgi:ABC-2 type transport system permease protein